MPSALDQHLSKLCRTEFYKFMPSQPMEFGVYTIARSERKQVNPILYMIYSQACQACQAKPELWLSWLGLAQGKFHGRLVLPILAWLFPWPAKPILRII